MLSQHLKGKDVAEETIKTSDGVESGVVEFTGEGAGSGEQAAVDTSTVVHKIIYRNSKFCFYKGRGRRGGVNSGDLGGGGTVERRGINGRLRVAFDAVQAYAGQQGINVAWVASM